jgi:UDP-N-acetylmuramate--L-alanine ligase
MVATEKGIMTNERKKLYFIGVAGHAMSGLAVAAKRKGYEVSGVAVNAYPPGTDVLAAAGIHFYETYDVEHVQPDMTIVLANAITSDNVELNRALELELTILSFPELIEQWAVKQRRVVVAGTHGKTTTATMIAWLLESAGMPVDFMMGMSSQNFGMSARHTDAPVVVLEGDEYSSSVLDSASKFSHYHPDILVVTSLEWDHPDLFPEFAMMKERFRELVGGMPADGLLVLNADAPDVMALQDVATCRVETYSSNGQPATHMAQDIAYSRQQTGFGWLVRGEVHGTMQTQLAGEHNVSNCLAALAVAKELSVPIAAAAEGLLSFTGAKRRFELVGEVNEVTVIDDYAHHPTEIGATLSAARRRFPDARIWAFFLPHTYSRTQAMLPYFAPAFISADVVIVGDIEGAREQTGDGEVTAADVLARLPRHGSQVHYQLDPVAARHLIVEHVASGDVVVCMSVSGAHDLAQQIIAHLQRRWPGT